MRKLALLSAFALGVAACASPGEPLDRPDTTSTTSVEVVTTTSSTPTTSTEDSTVQTVPRTDADLLVLAQQARSDLATHLGEPESEIAITGAALVVWNDGSIGCPQPGVSYTQALVDGARVTLMHDDVTYTYHQGGDSLFLCEEPAEDGFTVSKEYSGELEMVPPPGFDQ